MILNLTLKVLDWPLGFHRTQSHYEEAATFADWNLNHNLILDMDCLSQNCLPLNWCCLEVHYLGVVLEGYLHLRVDLGG